MNFIIRLALTTLAVLGIAYILPGVHISVVEKAVIVAIVIGLLNGILRPILVILTIPITIITLGLFLLVINAGMVMLADRLIGGFQVDNFWWALLFSILLSFAQGILYRMFGVKGKPIRTKDQG